ncbi:helix-turn-helix transcriptional regulator [Clostridiaceae bacterium Marseille-Q4143]|nr:helix-turn-helix transcriptional regulator [Clostridiaceae bacterium Marseille-Q4143]
MSSILREILAKNIRELRLSKQLSQEELADICGLHRTYISDIERGNRNVSIDNIEKIAKGLDVDPSILLEEQQ